MKHAFIHIAFHATPAGGQAVLRMRTADSCPQGTWQQTPVRAYARIEVCVV